MIYATMMNQHQSRRQEGKVNHEEKIIHTTRKKDCAMTNTKGCIDPTKITLKVFHRTQNSHIHANDDII